MKNSDSLARRIKQCMLRDRHGLEKRLAGVRRRARAGKPYDRALQGLTEAIDASVARRQSREASLPSPDYPDELPIAQRRAEIEAAIAAHQVVIVCGETGSGKTTQLPKICLGMGRGAAGLIGHTQPRRIAARSLASRIAEELKTEVAGLVGYKVRFSDRVGDSTLVKVMTDGLLLAETQSDPDLLAYDTLIVDEAHERSLNVDFLLGYLKRLCARRPDLKIIITSATIDPQSFSRHFDNAPVIEVSGRTYPVEVRYRPLQARDAEESDRDRGQAVLDAVDELAREGGGDVLVFLAGERDIRETAELLRKHHPPDTQVLPLYGRLSAAQQGEVFKPHRGRRIVLSTNVAETSLTVPGIRYVVDTGLARISRYSYRTKVQRLPIEAISQASANQRAGRCGRVAPGVCIRLYGEDDFQGRPEFTEPEIQRTNLAAVILQMLDLRLGEIEAFPFLDKPDPRFVRDAFRLLHELGAVGTDQCLSDIGHRLARLPVDVRIGRMVLAAEREACLREVLVIASALSVPDPRERPLEKRQAADEKHRQFADPDSDFLSFLKLWDFYHEQSRHLSRNKLRKLCTQQYLSYTRMRDWHDIHQQLASLVKGMGMKLNEQEADYANLHRALLTGLLGNVAFKTDQHEYTGARNLKLQLFPGSGLFKKAPKWIMAAELLETGRRYALCNARIDPRWLESLAKHLIKRNYFEPHWEKKPARVAAFERVTLYGLELVARRKVNFGPIDPPVARELFIRHALVLGEYQSRAESLIHNRNLIEELEGLEARARRRDVLIDEERVYEFFDRKLPPHVHNGAAFERWRKDYEQEHPRGLYLDRDYLMQHDAATVTDARFPPAMEVGGLRLELDYHFEPGSERDGLTVRVPLAALNQLRSERFEWLVPGMLEEKVAALIKSLPKQLRRQFVPVPDYAHACVEAIKASAQPLQEALARQLLRMSGVEVPPSAWRTEMLSDHHRARFEVLDSQGKRIAAGRDLEVLREQVGVQAAASFSELPSHPLEREHIERWDFGDLPQWLEIERDGLRLRAYPALCADKQGISLRLLDDPERAAERHRQGLLALFSVDAAKSIRYAQKNIPGLKSMCMQFAAVGTCDALRDDIIQAAVRHLLFTTQEPIRTQAEFDRRSQAAQTALAAEIHEVGRWVGAAMAQYQAIARRLKGGISPQWLAAIGDVRSQLDAMIYPGFVCATPYTWLPHLARFLKATERRLQRLEENPARDRKPAMEVAPLWERCQARMQAAGSGPLDPALEEYRWLLEEFRVSLFAQELKTSRPASAKRLAQLWKEIGA